MRSRRILVVDDSMTAREVIGDELEELGYSTTRVASAEEAMGLPGWERYDAYVLDIRLPGISGYDLLHEIKRAAPQAVVVLITQFEVARPERALHTYPNVWFFRKPAEMVALAATLKNAFEAQELRMDVERLRALTVGIKSVGHVRDLAQEFRVLLHLAVDSLTADAGGIFLLADPEEAGAGPSGERSLRLEVGVNLPSANGSESIPVEGGLARCLDRQEALVIPNGRINRVSELSRLFTGVGRVHMLAVPLTANHKLIGVLELFRDAERPAFTEKDVVLARLYAATSAVALENLRLSENAEAALRCQVAAQRELVQSRKLSSLGQVTAGLSHEIRNPLTVMVGNLDLIRRKGLGGEEILPYLDRIEGQVDRVLRLVQDLKAVYHPGEQAHGRFRLHDLVHEALALSPPPEGKVTVDLHTEADDDQVEGDFSQLLQVLVNLLTNAYQAMDEGGGGQVRVVVETSRTETQVVVEDDGPGIVEDLRNQIFEPFFTTKGIEGTGLGLWISASILRSHGGSLELGEAAGGGARFVLRIPRDLGAEVDAAAPPQAHPEGDDRVQVLVVDDAVEIREYLAELLEAEGYQVHLADGVKEAETALAEQGYDLIVLDGNLRGSSGSEFFVRTIKPAYGTPTIYFTGSDLTDSSELLALGLRAVIRKPARGHRILEAVRRALLTHVSATS
jgi:signal transduction histidine kinase